jgi:hypothetical protein
VVVEALRSQGAGRAWLSPRRDGTALGFGLAFLVLGVSAAARAAGLSLDARWLSPLILICLGVAGLASVLSERQRSRALEHNDGSDSAASGA